MPSLPFPPGFNSRKFRQGAQAFAGVTAYDLKADFSFPEPTFEDVAVEDFLESSVEETCFINSNLITFYKPDTVERIRNTYRFGFISYIGQGRRVFSVKGCSPTFVTASRGICGGTEAYLVNGRVRRLTVTEAKRILGFPEDFIFPVTEAKALALLGNSVAVPVLKLIAEQITATGIFKNRDGILSRPERPGGGFMIETDKITI